jgi:hypothetical protein
VRQATAAALALVIAGCAITSSYHTGPNGQPVHFIDGMTASAAYRNAAQLCPNGYTIIGSPDLKSAIDYVMTIECKPPGAVAAGRAPVQTPSPLQPVADYGSQAQKPRAVGRYSSEAGNLAEVRACNPYPPVTLVAQGPGFETFTVPCTNGDVASVRCESGGCRMLR